MRLLVFIVLILIIDIYTYQAIRLMSANLSRSARNAWIVTFFISSAVTFGYFILADLGVLDNLGPQTHQYWRAFVFIVVISKFFVAFFMLLDDVRRLLTWTYSKASEGYIYDSSRSKFLASAGILVGSLPLISLTYGMWRNPYRYRIRRAKVGIRNLPKSLEGLKIVQISDIHSGSFAPDAPLEPGIAMINDLQADLVFFTGDLVNTSAEEMSPFINVFNKIRAKYGVFSVLGNHDYGDYKRWDNQQQKEANFNQLLVTHEQLGWKLLRNENRIVEINGENVAVIGVENSSASPRFHNYGDLPKACEGTEESALKLLLSHDPSHWDAEVRKNETEIPLTFSGHTHGFQFGIEIPGWIKWSPSKYVYKQWAGLYTEGDQHLYVNRGFGMLGYPGRVGILPEITCIELHNTLQQNG